MELRIAVCDDEPIMLNEICKQAQKTAVKTDINIQAHKFDNGLELINQNKKTAFDIALLDIDMPITDGFKIAETLQQTNNKIEVIFVTNHDEKVYQSYEYHPFWFVRKSKLNELSGILAKLLLKLKIEYNKNNLFTLQTENGGYGIDFSKVVRFEADGHYVKVYTSKSGFKCETEIRCRISDIEKQLMPFHFVRIQSGYVVNCRFISKVTSRYVSLTLENISLHINRDRLESVRTAFQKYMRSER